MLKLDLPILSAACLLSLAFIFGLFFTGDGSLFFAPAVICLVLFSAMTLSRAETLSFSPLSLTMFGFWCYITLGLFWSDVPFVSFVTWLVLSALPLSWAGLAFYPDKEKLFTATGTLLLIFTGFLAIWAILQISLFKEIFGVQAHAPLLNPNNMAVIFNLALFPTLALFIAAEEKRIITATLALFFLLFTALLCTGSKGALLFFIPAFLLCLFLLRKTWMEKSHVLPALVLAMICAILIPVLYDSSLFTRLYNFVLEMLTFESLGERLSLWKAGLILSSQTPWTGSGAGTFYLFYPSIRDPLQDSSAGQFVHMDPLQFWLEMGILAPILFYGLFIALLAGTIERLKTTPHHSWDRLIIAATAPAILTFFFHMHISFPSYVLPAMILLGFLMAALHSVTSRTDAPEIRLHYYILYPVLCITVLVYAAGSASAALGFHFMEQAERDFAFKREKQALASLEHAKQWSPFFYTAPYIMEAQHYIEAPAFTPKDREKAWIALKKAAYFNTAQADISYLYGTLLLRSGQESSALPFYEETLERDPSHFKARMALVDAYEEKEMPVQAMLQIGQGIVHTTSPIALAFFESRWKELEPQVNRQRKRQTKILKQRQK